MSNVLAPVEERPVLVLHVAYAPRAWAVTPMRFADTRNGRRNCWRTAEHYVVMGYTVTLEEEAANC